MHAVLRFTPESLPAFNRTVGDLRSAYPAMRAAEAEDILAQIYGYQDAPSLRTAVLSGVSPGPFVEDEPPSDSAAMNGCVLRRFEDLAGSFKPIGSFLFGDFAVLETDANRYYNWALLNFIDDLLHNRVAAATD